MQDDLFHKITGSGKELFEHRLKKKKKVKSSSYPLNNHKYLYMTTISYQCVSVFCFAFLFLANRPIKIKLMKGNFMSVWGQTLICVFICAKCICGEGLQKEK